MMHVHTVKLGTRSNFVQETGYFLQKPIRKLERDTFSTIFAS